MDSLNHGNNAILGLALNGMSIRLESFKASNDMLKQKQKSGGRNRRAALETGLGMSRINYYSARCTAFSSGDCQ